MNFQESEESFATSTPGLPEVHEEYPQGLDYLSTLDSIFIEDQMNPIEIFRDVKAAARFFLFSATGQRAFFGAETSKRSCRCCFGQARELEVDLYDYTGTIVLNLSRPMTCALCMWGGDLCGDRLTVTHGNGSALGSVVQRPGFVPKYGVLDPDGKELLTILGPRCCGYCTLCRDLTFKIYFPDDLQKEVGRITSRWDGVLETKTQAYKYGATFPLELDIRLKATLLGALFLLDFMFFEDMKTKFSGLLCLIIILIVLVILGVVAAMIFINR